VGARAVPRLLLRPFRRRKMTIFSTATAALLLSVPLLIPPCNIAKACDITVGTKPPPGGPVVSIKKSVEGIEIDGRGISRLVIDRKSKMPYSLLVDGECKGVRLFLKNIPVSSLD
jgi:hypothetical protein